MVLAGYSWGNWAEENLGIDDFAAGMLDTSTLAATQSPTVSVFAAIAMILGVALRVVRRRRRRRLVGSLGDDDGSDWL